MKKLLFLLALAALLTACGSQEAARNDTAADQETTSAAENTENTETTGDSETTEAKGVLSGFTAQDLEGNEVDDSIFDDYDVTMVNVWGTFCGPCIQEMPDLGELAKEYEEKGLRIIGIVSDATDYQGGYPEETVDLAKEIVEETGADYLHLLPSQDLLDRVLSSIQAVPTTFFVDSDGNQLGGIITGAKSRDAWTAVFDEKLAEVQQ